MRRPSSFFEPLNFKLFLSNSPNGMFFYEFLPVMHTSLPLTLYYSMVAVSCSIIVFTLLYTRVKEEGVIKIDCFRPRSAECDGKSEKRMQRNELAANLFE